MSDNVTVVSVTKGEKFEALARVFLIAFAMSFPHDWFLAVCGVLLVFFCIGDLWRLYDTLAIDELGITLSRVGIEYRVQFADITKISLAADGLTLEDDKTKLLILDGLRPGSLKMSPEMLPEKWATGDAASPPLYSGVRTTLRTLAPALSEKVPGVSALLRPALPFEVRRGKWDFLPMPTFIIMLCLGFAFREFWADYRWISYLAIAALCAISLRTALFLPARIVFEATRVTYVSWVATRTYPVTEIVRIIRSQRGRLYFLLTSGKWVPISPLNIPESVLLEFLTRQYGLPIQVVSR